MQRVDGRRRKPVTFRFRNIGPVKKAELELGELTVIAGRNNTGKTYITYTLYGFLTKWTSFWRWFVLPNDEWPDAEFPNWKRLGRELAESGFHTFPLDEKELGRQRKRLNQLLTQGFSEQSLPDVFSSRSGAFEESSFEIVCDDAEHGLPRSYKSRVVKGRSVSIKYDGTEVVVAVEEEKEQLPHRALAGYVAFH